MDVSDGSIIVQGGKPESFGALFRSAGSRDVELLFCHDPLFFQNLLKIRFVSSLER